jgi:predicted regulator of Ras-like GTPase activity (Roadblock/LC7/MglB family)
MDAMQALRELTEISSQIEAACVFQPDGERAASTLADDAATTRFVDSARALLEAARRVPHDSGAGALAQLEAATLEGSVFVVLDGDLAAAAATGPEPTVGLVFYDLKSCLRAAHTPGDDDGRPRPKPRKRETSAHESAA